MTTEDFIIDVTTNALRRLDQFRLLSNCILPEKIGPIWLSSYSLICFAVLMIRCWM
jgi:hypothetical protein